MRFAMAVLAVSMMWGAIPTAWAQAPNAVSDDSKARLLFDNGAMLYEEGRYEDAIAAWQRAYELSPRPLLVFNIANAFERQGDWYRAHDALNRYRAFAPMDERPILDRRIHSLENRIAEEERRRGAPPPVVVEPEPPRDPPPELRSAWRIGVVPITLYSVSGASAIFGAVFALRAQSARKEAATLCTTGDAIYCPTTAEPALAQDRVSSWLADGGFGLAIGCAVAGTTVAVISKHRSNQTTLSVAPTFGGGRLGLSGRF
jgi:tetratricopeptide (TPR) repeat protein